MRPKVALLIAIAIAAPLGVSAASPPRRGVPPPSPVSKLAAADEGVVALRSPGPERILIRAGTFTMGSDEQEIALALSACKQEAARDECVEEMFASEFAPHPVYLDDYWIDRNEVSVARYRQCVTAGRCSLPPYGSGGERFDRPDFPVTLVNWSDAVDFCTWAGGHLPTEAQWERAARGIGGRRYPWGRIYNPFLANHGRFAWDDLDASDGFLELAPVGSFVDGRTPDGIFDLAGNVEEWVGDWFSPEYPSQSAHNPRGPDIGDERVVRGGSYVHARAWLRGAARGRDLPSARRSYRGFRCAYPG